MGLGSIAGSIGGSLGMKFIERKWAKDDASTARHWNENMSNTAHQREVRDLKAAGLNPILSAKYGGASTSAAPQTKPTTFDNPMSTAVQVKNTAQQTNESKARERLAEHNAEIASAKAGREQIQLEKEKHDYAQTYGKDPAVAGTIHDYPSAIKGPARDLATIGKKTVERIATPSTARGVKRILKEVDENLKKVDPYIFPESKLKGIPKKKKTSNKERADSYRRYLKKHPRKKSSNKKKAESYRKYLKENPRNVR